MWATGDGRGLGWESVMGLGECGERMDWGWVGVRG